MLILALITIATTTAAAIACDCDDICANETGWWHDGGAFNASETPMQAAVDNAGSGDVICVAAGSYFENVDIATPHLTLRGEGAGVVTVTAADSEDNVFEVAAGHVNISGFTATGATGSGKAGIYLNNRTYPHTHVSHCNISENNCSNSYWGICLYDLSNDNTLLGNNVSLNSHYGIRILESSNNTLLGNNVHSNSDYGIHLSYSGNNTLLGNNIHSNDDGIYMSSLSNGNTLESNDVSSNNDYGINLCGSCNNTLVNNNVSSNKYGIDMYTLCNNNILMRNSCSNNTYHGIGLLGLNNTCVDNNCSNNYLGIDMYSSSNNTVTGNTVSNNHCGIDVSSSSNNMFESNNVSSNDYRGIEIASSSNNTLLNNTVNSNSEYGIYLRYSSDNNLIYNNYFNNTKNAYDNDINQWNITKTNGTNIIGGPFLGGNYWSDYAGVDNTGDGLGDTMLPYSSSSHIQNGGDYHPLVSAAAIPCDCDIYVNPSGWWHDGGAFNANATAPIQAAVGAATTGETICVAAGSYFENVDIATPHLTLRGEGADVVTVTAANPNYPVFYVTADYVNISGFTATGTTGGYLHCAGFCLDDADNCNIYENTASNNCRGIWLRSSCDNTLASNTANSNNDSGILLYPSSDHNTLTNNTASNADFGVYLQSSSGNTLVSNTASNNGYGILLMSSSNNTLTSNNCSNNYYGTYMCSSSNNALANNTANSNNGHGIYLFPSSNNTFTNNIANSNNGDGIYLSSSSNNTLVNNTANSNNGYGIRGGSNSTLVNNIANSNNDDGIVMMGGNNTLANNTANSNNDDGIVLWSSCNNTLTNNNMSSNSRYGIRLLYSSNNTLLCNTVHSNSRYGIHLHQSSNNLIYNNFFNNAHNSCDYGNNQWNITKTSGANIVGGPFLGGNYWSDYAGVDNTGDGLGDTSLPHRGDYHPLISAAVPPCDGDIYVNETGWWHGGGAFNASETPMQAAVDNAGSGDVICVAAGSYTENVNVNKQLTLAGEGADLVTVTAANSDDHVFFVTAGSVNISGFTATGAGVGKAGIYLDNQTFLDRYADHCNIFDNNCSKNYRGIWLYKSRNNTLANNTANSNNDSGIYLWISSNNSLNGNIASNNYYGIHLWTSCNNTLVNNNASSNTRQGIHLQASSNNNMFIGNSCSNNSNDGIYLFDSSNNTFADNNCSNNGGDGISLQSSYSNSCNNRVTGNMVSNNHHGIYLWDASNNTLVANTVYSSDLYGIYMHSSRDNGVTCNLVQNNTDCGIYLASGSTGNNITWNNIVANGELQTDDSCHYQFKNSQSDDVDAINNFWGSEMNNSTIDLSIYDDEDGRAEVEFYPFETKPVPCAPAPISEEPPAFTTTDVVIALQIAVGSRPLDLRYDVSGDGRVTSLDALMSLQAVAGNITL